MKKKKKNLYVEDLACGFQRKLERRKKVDTFKLMWS